MFLRRVVRCAVVVVLLSCPLWGQVTELGPLIPQGAASASAHRASVSDLFFAAPRLTAAEMHDLGALTASERARLMATDSDGSKRGLKVGIERVVPSRVGLDRMDAGLSAGQSRSFGGGLLEAHGSSIVWTTVVRSPGANALRLELVGSLPPGSRAFLYASTGEVHGPYGSQELSDGGFWTNTIYSDEAYLEVQFSKRADAAAATLHVRAVAHIEAAAFAPAGDTRVNGTECFVDASCVAPSEFPDIAVAGAAMAQLIFQRAGGTFVCSGGLLNNTRQDRTPYFLTANHCFDTQAAASSLEATWNYKTTSCADPNIQPNRNLFPRSLGATLLATSGVTDFTLVRLNQPPPANALFLGWNAQMDVSQSGGTKLYRVHHPLGATQFYARHSVVTNFNGCPSRARGNYIHMFDEVGGAAGGSSGAPVLLSNLAVVGQLFGACGPNVSDDCDRANRTFDGAFRATFPSIQQFLAPTTSPAPCVANSTTACMLNGRFRTTVRYRGAFDNAAANLDASVKSVTGFAEPNFETAFFFFNSSANIEMLVKILDQGNTDAQGRPTIAVLFGSATPLRVELEIMDTQTGTVKRYQSEFGQSRGAADFTAFLK